MFNQIFYHSLIKKYVITFGSLFSNIYIERSDAANTQIASIKVPIQYAPKEKMFTRLLADPDLDRQYSVLLPRMSFEISPPGFQYDTTRKLTSIDRYVVKDTTNANKVKYQYNPVPYNIFFSLYVYTKSVEDGLKIVEQIIPFFTPDFTPTLHIIPEMNEHRDVPIELTSGPIMTDIYTADFKTRRMVYWTMNFTMRAYMFGPVKKAPIIKYANTTILVPISQASTEKIQTWSNGEPSIANSSPMFRTIITPGLTAEGEPTSNAALSIPVSEIFLDQDFGFIIAKEDLET